MHTHTHTQAIQSSFNSGNGTGTSFSDNEMTVAIAIFAIGGMLGALPAGIIADLLGRYNRNGLSQSRKLVSS